MFNFLDENRVFHCVWRHYYALRVCSLCEIDSTLRKLCYSVEYLMVLRPFRCVRYRKALVVEGLGVNGKYVSGRFYFIIIW